MLETSKEKAALWAAESLVVGFSCEVEAQSRDFAVALDEELAHAKRDEVFVNLDFYRFMLTYALDGEACFDVHVHGIVLVYWLVVGCGKIAGAVSDLLTNNSSSACSCNEKQRIAVLFHNWSDIQSPQRAILRAISKLRANGIFSPR